MSTLQETINSLYLLCGTILLTAAYFLYRAIDFQKKKISFNYWFAAFSGFFLGGGGLQTLLSANKAELENLFFQYEINKPNIESCYIPWILFTISVILLSRFLNSDFEINSLKFLYQSKNSVFLLNFCILIFSLVLLICLALGGIGYMGQTVGTDNSPFEVNPFYSLIALSTLGLGPLTLVSTRNLNFPPILCLCSCIMIITGAVMGRRLLGAMVIAAGIVILLTNLGVLKKLSTYTLILAAALLCIFCFRFFYGLRLASWELTTNLKERSFFTLAPKALEYSFSSDSFLSKDFKAEYGDNKKQRPFMPIGYLIFVNSLFLKGPSFHGELLINNVQTLIPRVFYPNKDKMIEEGYEEETFVQRFQNLPSGPDEAPTIIVAGIINFGLWGIPIQVSIVFGVVVLMIYIAKLSGSLLCFMMTAFLLLVQLQQGEFNLVLLLEAARFIFLLYLIFFTIRFFILNENSLFRKS